MQIIFIRIRIEISILLPMSIFPHIVDILEKRITQIDFRINLTSLHLYTLYVSQARQSLSWICIQAI